MSTFFVLRLPPACVATPRQCPSSDSTLPLCRSTGCCKCAEGCALLSGLDSCFTVPATRLCRSNFVREHCSRSLRCVALALLCVCLLTAVRCVPDSTGASPCRHPPVSGGPPRPCIRGLHVPGHRHGSGHRAPVLRHHPRLHRGGRVCPGGLAGPFSHVRTQLSRSGKRCTPPPLVIHEIA